MKTFLLIFSLFLVTISSAQTDTTSSSQDYFLTFVKKVYLNPTVYLRTTDFKERTNLGFVALPDLSSAQNNANSGFEKGLQKLLRLLMQTDGGVRFYFNPDNPTHPFTFWSTDNLWCKFKQPEKDSIDYYLNHAFSDSNLDLNNNQRFESTIDQTLDYIERVLAANPTECGDEPQNETTSINTKPLAINVHNTQGSKYDIDYRNYVELASYYAVAFDEFTQQEWPAPSKIFVTKGVAEPLVLSIDLHDPQFKTENLKIQLLKTAQVLPHSFSNDSVRFNLPEDMLPSDPVEIVVKYKSQVDSVTYTVGFFMVNPVKEKTNSLVLLGANGYVISNTDVNNIQAYVNRIYEPAGVKFTVSSKSNHFPDESPTLIQDEGSGLLSNYPSDLHDYVGEIKDLEEYTDSAYYLVLGLNNTNSDLLGYMPRARNIGFIFFQQGSSNYSLETVAHELGHGAFHFCHIFDEDELGESNARQTHNVMDYASVIEKEALYLHQWNYIQDPAFVSWFGGDDNDAELLGETGSCYYYHVYFNTNGTVSHREYAGRCDYYKNGPKDALYTNKKVTDVHVIEKYFRKVKGEWESYYYHPTLKVKYLVQEVDLAYNHVRFKDHYDHDFLRRYPEEIAKKSDEIRTVKKLVREGETDPYAYKVYDYKLNEVCDGIFDRFGGTTITMDLPVGVLQNSFTGNTTSVSFTATSTGVQAPNLAKKYYAFNDKWLSDEFLAYWKRYQDGEVTPCNVISWLENHPCADIWSTTQAEDHAKEMFDVVTYDNNEFLSPNNIWRGKALVESNGNPEFGIEVWCIYDGAGGGWIRKPVSMQTNNFADNNTNVHRKYGFETCTHTLNDEATKCAHLKAMLTNSDNDAEDLAEYISGEHMCFLYGLDIDLRKKILYKFAQEDGDYGWIENDKNVLLYLIRTTLEKDEIALLHTLIANKGKLLTDMFALMNETFDDDDPDLGAMKEAFGQIHKDVLKHKDHFQQTEKVIKYVKVLSDLHDPFRKSTDPVKKVDIPLLAVELPLIIGGGQNSTYELGSIEDPAMRKLSAYGENAVLKIKTSTGHAQSVTIVEDPGTHGLRLKVKQRYTLYECYKENVPPPAIEPVEYYTQAADATSFQSILPENQPDLSGVISQINLTPDRKIFEVEVDYVLHPYDIVTFINGSNAGSEGLTRGEIYTAPAIYALLLDEMMSSHDENERVRFWTDVADVALAVGAVAAAPATGGSSLAFYFAVAQRAVSIVAGFKGVIDLGVQHYQQDCGAWAYQTESYKTWQKVCATTDVANVVFNLPSGVHALKTSYGAIRNYKSIAFGLYFNYLVRTTQLTKNAAPGLGSIPKTFAFALRTEKTYDQAKVFIFGQTVLNSAGDWQTIKKNILNRIVGKQGWSLKYADNEIQDIVSNGKGLDLPDIEIEDIIFNGCRPDKSFTKADLISQSNFWNVVKQRGYPNLFQSLQEYEQFSDVIKSLALEWNLPTDVIYVQGSSLRMNNIADIGDLDIAIKVDAVTFENLVVRFKAAADNQTSINRIGNNGKIGGIDMFQSSGVNGSFTGNFYPKFQSSFGQTFQSKLGVSSIQISIVKEGSSIDVSPFLKLK